MIPAGRPLSQFYYFLNLFQTIICVFVDVYILYIALLLHVNHFVLWFEFSIWVLIFAYLKFARIFIRGSFFLQS